MVATCGVMLQLLSLLTLSIISTSAWLQQYGDAQSSCYAPFDGAFAVNWNYTTDPFSSLQSPAISPDGTIFIPGRAYVMAVSVQGKLLWNTGVAPDGDAYQTNVLYLDILQLVVVGTSWVLHDNYFMLVAMDAKTGKVVWKSQHNDLFHATTLSISPLTLAVYVGGFDQQVFAGVNVKDGSLLWKQTDIPNLGIFMQTKVSGDGKVVFLPTDPFDGFSGKGRMYAYTAESPGKVLWFADVGFSAGGQFASSNDILHGSVGGGGGLYGMTIFGIAITNGSVLWNTPSCCSGQTSGPAVDKAGNAYYNCGNRLFSVDAQGRLRWVSAPLGNATLNSVTSPAVHRSGFVFFIHNDHSTLYALSSSTGELLYTYRIPVLGYTEPPMLLGDAIIYLSGLSDNSVCVYSLRMFI